MRRNRAQAARRVSTGDQTTDNQIREIVDKGFVVEPHRIVTETISGSMPASQRPGFQKLLNKLEKGDKLIVTKLDRLGRNAVDVETTIEQLTEAGIDVHCLALPPGLDMGTAIGTMMLKIITAFAQFEKDLLIERTHAGLKRAKAQGKVFGRPKALTPDQVTEIKDQIARGITISQLAKALKVSRATVMRANVTR